MRGIGTPEKASDGAKRCSCGWVRSTRLASKKPSQPCSLVAILADDAKCGTIAPQRVVVVGQAWTPF